MVVKNIFPISVRYALKALADEECQEAVSRIVVDGVVCGGCSKALHKLEKGNIVRKVVVDGRQCFTLTEYGKELIEGILKVVVGDG